MPTPGEPTSFSDPRGGARYTYMVDTGVTYGFDRKHWGFSIREATARKLLTPASVTLGEKRGGDRWYPYPHGVALVFLDAPDLMKSAAQYPGVDLASENKGHLESLVRAKWPEYFEGSVKAPPPPLREGDHIRATRALGRGVVEGTEMEVTRVTPQMIYTDNNLRVPQEFYMDGRVVKVGAFRERVIRLAAVYLSAHSVGDPVWVQAQGNRLAGHVRAVTFTTGKVRYAVKVGVGSEEETTFHNLDSVVVEPRPEGERVTFAFDNYS